MTSVKNGFGGVGFRGLAGAVLRVEIEGRHVRPLGDPFFDAGQKGLFGRGECGVGAKRGPDHGVGHDGVAGDADGAVIFLCARPGLPPKLAGIEKVGGGGFIP